MEQKTFVTRNIPAVNRAQAPSGEKLLYLIRRQRLLENRYKQLQHMTLKLSDVVKNKAKVDIQDICTGWTWLISKQKSVLLVTVFGDMFLVGPSNEINWLDCGASKLEKVANSLEEFQELLKDKQNFANWFLTNLYTELQTKGVTLKDNEVYGYKKAPILGGTYTTDNIEPTDMSVHFYILGQIGEQTKDLPDGTKVELTTEKKKPWWKKW